MAERSRELTGLRRVSPADADQLLSLFEALAERDLSFLEHPLDQRTLSRWGADDDAASRWVVAEDDHLSAYMSVIPAQGWSSHVGDLRLVVSPSHRGEGLGRRLARHGLLEGVALGLRKITVAVAADKDGDIEMFTSIGFRGEALLEDHIRDRDGELHDLVLLSHDVSQVREDMAALGIDGAVGLEGA